MKRRALLALIVCPFIAACQAAEPGFTALFNGKDLTGWTKVNGNGEYRIEDGCIVGFGENVGSNTFLRTDKTYKDFDFRFEMKFDDLSGNSGMMFRGLQRDGNGRVYGYQCEHDNDRNRAWTAGLYDEARRGWLAPYRNDAKKEYSKAEQKKHEDARKDFTAQGKKIFKWDDWNEIRIVCKGKRIQIWLNGEERVDFRDDAPEFTPEGFFALQVHSGKSCKVRWRNLRIKEL